MSTSIASVRYWVCPRIRGDGLTAGNSSGSDDPCLSGEDQRASESEGQPADVVLHAPRDVPTRETGSPPAQKQWSSTRCPRGDTLHTHTASARMTGPCA